MGYKILYIEDLEAETRNLTFTRDNFVVESFKPNDSIDKIISEINEKNPDLIILDYILTEGSNLKFCNAPTIASTLRSLTALKSIQERPIILMSTQDHIVNTYRKDYTSHDLFDYAITKQNATKVCTDKFINKCISFIEAYKKIEESNFNLTTILDIETTLIHSKVFSYLNENNRYSYEYSRFIFEHIIRASGLLVGEDILSSRLGVSKKSKDWNKLKDFLQTFMYSGIFSNSYKRWWFSKIENWWKENLDEKHSMRHYDSSERTKILSKKLNLDLTVAEKSKNNFSINYWTICKETKMPLDPFDGIELLEEEFKPWQDKEYVSVDGYLSDVEKYSKIVNEADRKEMRNFR